MAGRSHFPFKNGDTFPSTDAHPGRAFPGQRRNLRVERIAFGDLAANELHSFLWSKDFRPELLAQLLAVAKNSAREQAKRENVEVVIHRRNSTIRDSDSYGKDPNPPKDKRH